jgi:hypothetical protein
VRLSGHRTSLGRALSRVVAWVTVPLFIAGMGSNFWLEHRFGLAHDSSVEDMLVSLGFGGFAVVGSVLVAKRPNNPVSWIMLTIGLMAGLFPAAETYAAYVMTTRGQPDALAVFGAWVNAWYWYLLLALALIFLPLLFPDGHLPSRRWLLLAVLASIGTAGVVGLGALTDVLIGQEVAYQIDNPIGVDGIGRAEDHLLFAPFGILGLVGLVGATTAMVIRFRRSRGVERQQLKWFLYAVALLPLLPITDSVPVIGDLLFGLILVALPTTIGIAVLRYRLYDIDLIIRRTLVYTALTLTLGFVYVGCIVVSRMFVARLVGGSDVAIVASTLAIAALFAPLRRRIQKLIDKRFYRRKYDAARVLAAFGVTVRDETDLERLSAEMLRVVDETMQPEFVGLWLREPQARSTTEAAQSDSRLPR